MGSGMFCFKACYNSNDFSGSNLCQNVSVALRLGSLTVIGLRYCRMSGQHATSVDGLS